MNSSAFLVDVKVVSAALQFPGPYCTMLLADLGASVIQIEPPGGDPARGLPAFFDGTNRNKRSIAVDLKTPQGQDVVHKLVRSADVFFEGFRPGVASRLGLSWDALHALNPALVYCSISGYGQSGSRAQWSGHDINYAATAGVLDLNTDEAGVPRNHGLPIGDLTSGMMAALSSIAALHRARATGRGTLIDLAVTDVLMSMMGTELTMVSATGRHRLYEPGYGVFIAADGGRLALGIAHEDHFWRALCQCIGMEESDWDLSSQERLSERARLRAAIQERLAQRESSFWLAVLVEKDVPCSRVNSVSDLPHDPYVTERNLLSMLPGPHGRAIQVRYPALLDGSPPHPQGRIPSAGQDSREILTEVGYTSEQIERLIDSGVIVEAARNLKQ